MPERPARPDAPPTWWGMHLWQIQPVRDLLVIAAIACLVYLGHALSLVTVPMLLALLLAYLFEPLVRMMTRRGAFSRPGAVITIILTLFVIFVLPASLGVGAAAVQGLHAARRVAVTTGDLKSVFDFSRNCIEDESGAAGATSVVHDPDGSARSLIFQPGTAKAKPDAETATAAFHRLPRTLQDAATRIVDLRLKDAGLVPSPEPGEEPRPAGSKTSDLSALLDTSVAWVQDNAAAVSETLGKSAIGSGAGALTAVLHTFRGIAKLGLTLFLTAFFFYFFSTGWGRVLAFWDGLIPERKRGRILELLQKMDRVIAGFVRGRLTICAIIMVYYTIAYRLIGVPAPLLLGPLVGAFALVPFLTIVAIPVSIVLMALQPSDVLWQQHWWWILGAPVGVYLIERAMDDYLLTPTIQRHHTEMAIPAILFASLAGGILGGVYGLLIAIPVAACLRILLREVFWPRFKLWAEGRERDFLPISSHHDDTGPSPVA
jgi:predicted PurR-regulated permease PerM